MIQLLRWEREWGVWPEEAPTPLSPTLFYMYPVSFIILFFPFPWRKTITFSNSNLFQHLRSGITTATFCTWIITRPTPYNLVGYPRLPTCLSKLLGTQADPQRETDDNMKRVQTSHRYILKTHIGSKYIPIVCYTTFSRRIIVCESFETFWKFRKVFADRFFLYCHYPY